jgi:2-polyprenyl-6-methoxyphenol hydroxylase-like FAD-dependent oxidoreductase
MARPIPLEAPVTSVAQPLKASDDASGINFDSSRIEAHDCEWPLRAARIRRSVGPLSAVRDVVIAGAGIGGLTAAIALTRAGIGVRVLERAAAIHPAGAGLALQPNAMAVLATLGLDDAVAAAGAALSRAVLLDPAGRPLGPETRFERILESPTARVIALHRARLHDVLLKAAGSGVVRTGVRVTGYEQAPGRVSVAIDDGSRLETELLVGADGLHSAVRAQMCGHDAPRYAGYTSWRGITPAGSVAAPDRVTETWGRGERFGVVDIGFGEIYWFAVADAPQGGTDGDVRAELRARFGGWHAPVPAVLEATPADRILRTDIFDREPITRWHDGRVVLLGDAAHPMTPNLGQGAAQAIEDAGALAASLQTAASIEEGLHAYETARVRRTRTFVLASRRFGKVAQWRQPLAVFARDLMMRLTPEFALVAQVRRMLSAR